jgi:NADPH2:quinone reductase
MSAPRRRRAIALAAFGGPEVLELVEEPMAEPAPHETLVAVRAAGVNFGDLMVRRGEYRRDQSLAFRPGFEVAGIVAQAAADGSGPPAGMPVAAFTENGGGYADLVAVPSDRVYAVEAGLDPARVAGVFIQGVTAWYAVHRYGRVRPEDRVLVHGGAGGLGGLAIQLAREAGAVPYATASTETKRAVARAHGAEEAFDTEPSTLAARVREATAGHGVDVVVDGVGGAIFTPSMRALAHGGRYVVAGSASQQPAMIDVRTLMPRGQIIAGFVVARVAEEDPREPGGALARVCAMLRDGALAPVIEVAGLQDAADVHRRLEDRSATGKFVLMTDRAGGRRPQGACDDHG